MRNTGNVVWGRFGPPADRIVSRDGLWFFAAREGEKGPYLSRLEAERALTSYIELIELLESSRPTPD